MKEKITLGRNPESDIHVPETFDTVSNEHADITLSNGVLTFTDHSSNGSIVNGNKIKGQSITIQKGDTIVLAGKYDITWDSILAFFPNMSRSTVLLGDDNDSATKGRATMNINEIFDGSEPPAQAGRNTEYINSDAQNSSATEMEGYGGSIVTVTKRKRPIDKTILWSCIGAVVILIAYILYLFNDLIYNFV